MRADDRSRDEKPEADALRRIVGGSSGQRLEDHPLCGKRDRITPIVHAERNALVRAMSLEGDRASTPMLDRVPHQVRYDLRKSIGVPFTADVPAHAETHDRPRMRGLHLQKYLVTQTL